MELSRNQWNQVVDNVAKPKSTSFFPLQKFKGNQLVPKLAAMHLEHLEEENTKRDEEVDSKTQTVSMELQKSSWYVSLGP